MFTTKTVIVDVALLSCGLAWLLSWYVFAPPYVWVNDQLVQSFELHSPMLLGLLPILVLSLVYLIHRMRRVSLFDQTCGYAELVPALQRRFFYLIVAMGLSALMAWLFFSLANNAPTSDAPALELLANEPPAQSVLMRRVNVQGVAVSKFKTISRDHSNPSWTQLQRFVPILDKTTDRTGVARGNAKSVFYSHQVSSNESVLITSATTATEGYVSWRLLPYSARKAYRQDGLHVPIFSYVLQDHYISLRPYYLAAAGFFVCLTLFFFVRIFLTKPVHRKRLQRAWDYEYGYSPTKDVAQDVFPWSSSN